MKYIIKGGTILDGTKEMQAQTGKVIFINGETIERIEEEPAKAPEGYEVIDATGLYIMPGLINMHVHLAGNGRPQKKQRDNAKLVRLLFSNPLTAAVARKMVEGYAKIELMSGVTTIRTVGGLRDLDGKLRDLIAAGKKEKPRKAPRFCPTCGNELRPDAKYCGRCGEKVD